MEPNILSLTAVFVVALLYSSVGHGGASGYLAILSLMAVPKQTASTTALILNILVAGLASASFYRAGFLNIRSTFPYLLTSIPAAFVGGMIRIPNNIYEWLLSICLSIAALRLAIPLKDTVEDLKPPNIDIAAICGAIIGLVSGIVGIGGGIFLSPLIVIAGWDHAKNASGTAAFFIVVNSIAGLVGRIITNSFSLGSDWTFLLAAAAGGLIGSHLGANIFSQITLKRVLALVLGIASVKLLVA